MTQKNRFIISEQLLFTGLAQDTVSALNLPLFPGEVSVNKCDEGHSISAFIPELSQESLFERIVSLIKLAMQDSSLTNCDTPILWLLPELQWHQDDLFTQWTDKFKSLFPNLVDRTVKFFPYGRAALPMALNYLTQLPKQSQLNKVCILAVDSHFFRNDGVTVYSNFSYEEQTWIPSEGLAYIILEQQTFGLEIIHSNHDSAASYEKLGSIENLFSQQSDFSEQLSYLYLPGNGDQKLVTPWALAYQTLDKVITIGSQIIQTGYHTAELGCVTGLYNLMHIYDNYNEEVYQGDILQLEISDNIYSSVALYRWMSKE